MKSPETVLSETMEKAQHMADMFKDVDTGAIPESIRRTALNDDQSKVFRNFCIKYRKDHKNCKEREVRRALIRKFNIKVEKS